MWETEGGFCTGSDVVVELVECRKIFGLKELLT